MMAPSPSAARPENEAGFTAVEIPVPLFSRLLGIGKGEYNDIGHFAIDSVFWTITRLFESYERILSACQDYKITHNPEVATFTGGDVEHFIIRFRVILNDIAFLIRQQLSAQVRYLPEPHGPGAPQNHEFSMHDLIRFCTKQPRYDPYLTRLIECHRSWIDENIFRRDAIIHFKSKAHIVFGEGLEVAFIDRQATTSDKLPTKNVEVYVNASLLNLWKMMHVDLVKYLDQRIADGVLRYEQVGLPGSGRFRCIGMRRFIKINSSAECFGAPVGQVD
jgi:hypothetical protein